MFVILWRFLNILTLWSWIIFVLWRSVCSRKRTQRQATHHKEDKRTCRSTQPHQRRHDLGVLLLKLFKFSCLFGGGLFAGRLLFFSISSSIDLSRLLFSLWNVCCVGLLLIFQVRITFVSFRFRHSRLILRFFRVWGNKCVLSVSSQNKK